MYRGWSYSEDFLQRRSVIRLQPRMILWIRSLCRIGDSGTCYWSYEIFKYRKRSWQIPDLFYSMYRSTPLLFPISEKIFIILSREFLFHPSRFFRVFIERRFFSIEYVDDHIARNPSEPIFPEPVLPSFRR